MNWYVHVEIKKNNFSFLESEHSFTAEKMYSVNLADHRKKMLFEIAL